MLNIDIQSIFDLNLRSGEYKLYKYINFTVINVTSNAKTFLAVSVQTAKRTASGQIKTGRIVVLTGGVNDRTTRENFARMNCTTERLKKT